MALKLEEIKKIIQNPVNKNVIPIASNHELRLRFHSETTLTKFGLNHAVTMFLNWVAKLIPPDKFKIFCHLFRFPLKSVSLTDEIFSALEKVFDGQNPVFYYEFTDSQFNQDWEKYRSENLKEPMVWKTKGFETMKGGINSVMIVDLPSEQTTEFPEPYFYFLPIDNVIDFGDNDGEIQWLIFRQPENTIAVFDDGSFRTFKIKNDASLEIIGMEKEIPHSLGYCPARFFWSTPMTFKTPSIKQSPITNHLADLDWYLFYLISKRNGDLYIPWPIYWGYEQDCDFEDSKTGESCHGGFLKTVDDHYIVLRDGTLTECPRCSQKRITGVGSFIDVPAPGEHNNNTNLAPPAGVIPTDTGALKYSVDEIQRMAKEIYTSVTGSSIETINNQAVNELQVTSIFEARKAVLLKIKTNFELAQKWVDSTVCKLRYGNDFIDCLISYGTEFYLFTPDQLMGMYNTAREKNMDDSTLDFLQNQYFETLFRNDPKRLMRQRILLNIDPFRHLTKKDVLEMFKSGYIDFKPFMLKQTFSSLVMSFERDNGLITDFGIALRFEERIKRIREGLESYIPQQKTPEPQPQ